MQFQITANIKLTVKLSTKGGKEDSKLSLFSENKAKGISTPMRIYES